MVQTMQQAWPFLISTDATSGFITIVAPQFMIETGITDLLRLVTEGEVTPPDAVYLRTLMGSSGNALIVVYRIVPALGDLLHLSNDTLYDHQGRRILLIEGAVIPAHPAYMTQLVFTANDFTQVRLAYEAAFRAVWEHPTDIIHPSESFALDGNTQSLRHLYQSSIILPKLAPIHEVSHDSTLLSPDNTSPTIRKN